MPPDKRIPGTTWTPFTDVSSVFDVGTNKGMIVCISAGNVYRRVEGQWILTWGPAYAVDVGTLTGLFTVGAEIQLESRVYTFDRQGQASVLPTFPEQIGRVQDLSGPSLDSTIWVISEADYGHVFTWYQNGWHKQGGPSIVAVSAGHEDACFVGPEGGIYAWDNGNYTNLGVPISCIDIATGQSGHVFACSFSGHQLLYYQGVGNWPAVPGVEAVRVAADSSGLAVICDSHGMMFQRT